MGKIRILMVIPSLEGGGAERVMVNLVNHLNRDLFEPYLYVERFEGKYARELRSDVKVICAGDRRGFSRLFFLAGQIRKLRPQIVFVMMLPLATVATRLAHVGAMTVIRETESRPAEQFQQSLLPRLLNRWAFRLAKRYIAPADATKHYLVQRYHLSAKQICVINNPVNIQEVRDLAGTSGENPRDKLRLIGVGRLTYQKGFDLLIRALSEVQGFAWKLRIVGNGPLEDDLKDQARRCGLEEQIEFMGFQENPYPLMRSSDLLVLSSRWEGLPNVILEAMAVGVAVLATRCPTGPDEIITPGVDGELCEIESESLARHIESLAKDRNMLNHLAAGGTRRVADFDLPTIVKKYETYFTGLVAPDRVESCR